VLNEGKNLKIHANNFIVDGNYLSFISTAQAYFTLSLPKGYRFTGYKIVLYDKYSAGSNSALPTFKVERNAWTFAELDNTLTEIGTSGTKISLNNPTVGSDYTLSRTSTNMANILYFKLTGGTFSSSSTIAAFAIKSFEVTFECDNGASFTTSVVPADNTATGDAMSVANASFNTGKSDINELTKSSKTGYFSYNYKNETDLFANNQLYVPDAITAGKTDATVGTKTIYSVISGTNKYYGLKNNTYYVETPTSATAQGNINIPLGYRIVGATLHYAYGDASKQTYNYATSYLISYEFQGINYYLNTSGNFVQVSEPSQATRWTYNSTNGTISSGNYYLIFNNNGFEISTTSNNNKLSIANNRIQYSYTSGRNTYTYYLRAYEESDGTYDMYYTSSSTNSYLASANTYTSTSVGTTTSLGSASSYKITLYDKDGTTEVGSADVSASNASGDLTISGLNNDAIKFKIEGVSSDNGLALVTVDLQLEALNPYVNSFDIVAKSSNTAIPGTVSQTYATNDFTVGQDKTFAVPQAFHANGLNITFDQLKNKHADNTYYDKTGTGNSRYNFVESPYYTTVNEDLYTNAATVANHDYADKVKVEVAGKNVFKFNNAADLSSTSTLTSGYLNEYPFSVSTYGASNFAAVTLGSAETTKTVYLFTEDETRYNIAPTTATMHVYYAFYTTTITVEDKTYTPSIAYKVVYNSTYHNDAADATPYVGAIVSAKDDANTVLTSGGYLTAKQITDQMTSDLNSTITNAPKDKAHIIYIDASKLNAVSEGSDGTLDAMKEGTATNSLVYLPLDAIHTTNNFAFKTVSGGYDASDNIVLTDKEPFFAPYDIQVDATHYADYKREASTASIGTNGVVEWGTFVLPFTLKELKEGVHSDDYGTVTLLQMNATNATKITGTDGYDGKVFFSAISGEETKANTPYALHRTDNKAGDYSFAFKQYGSNIVATPQTSAQTYFTPSDLGTSTGTLSGKTYTFTHQGSFSGALLDKTNPKTYYFSRNAFYSSVELDANHPSVFVNPFRTFYSYNANGDAKGYTLYMQIGENDETTGITDITGHGARNIVAGVGTITVTAVNGNEMFRIVSLAGQSVGRLNLQSGESETVAVPAGLYIVNGVKVIVK
jgi:hypothetical protein